MTRLQSFWAFCIKKWTGFLSLDLCMDIQWLNSCMILRLPMKTRHLCRASWASHGLDFFGYSSQTVDSVFNSEFIHFDRVKLLFIVRSSVLVQSNSDLALKSASLVASTSFSSWAMHISSRHDILSKHWRRTWGPIRDSTPLSGSGPAWPCPLISHQRRFLTWFCAQHYRLNKVVNDSLGAAGNSRQLARWEWENRSVPYARAPSFL